MRRQWLRLALRRPGRSTQVTESGSHGTWGGAQEPERHHGRNLAAVEAAMALLLQAVPTCRKTHSRSSGIGAGNLRGRWWNM